MIRYRGRGLTYFEPSYVSAEDVVARLRISGDLGVIEGLSGTQRLGQYPITPAEGEPFRLRPFVLVPAPVPPPDRKYVHMANAAVSLEPDDFVQGGLLTDVDVEFNELQFCGWDYNGALTDGDVLAVKVTLLLLDENGRPDPAQVSEQYWSCGPKFDECGGVSEDGHFLLPSEKREQLTRGSNFFHLLESLRAAGMIKGYLADGNLSKLKGLRAHVNRKVIKRAGLENTSRRSGGENETLVVTRVIWAPWDGKAKPGGAAAAKPAAASKAGAKPPAAAAADAPPAPPANDEITAKAVQTVKDVLAENSGMVDDLKKLRVACFRKYAKDKAEVRNAVVAVVDNEAWLTANGFSVVDGAVMSAT